ncbi:hypothetical protein [Thiolapillus sp.]|uniref:hypothetical protein n=1 Tax=Thiolapillus sp. TaxID=2017437 RepID=UPI003AF41EE2
MTRTAGARIGCQRPSRFWGLGCPKIYHEVEDTLVFYGFRVFLMFFALAFAAFTSLMKSECGCKTYSISAIEFLAPRVMFFSKSFRT